MGLQVDITKRFKGFTLQVKFNSAEGTLGVLGASGCGKSLTLQCIAGIITPNEGSIVLNGRVLYSSAKKINLKPQQRRVGYLFQSYALFPNMTVEQNIASGMQGTKQQKAKRTEQMLQRYQLEGLQKRLPRQLSGGQQQRVALARIFASEPEVLLLDEPFSALDAYLRETLQLQMLETLKEYTGDVIMVTHSRDEVYNLCHNIVILQQGRALIAGNTKQLFKQPIYTQAARLTGCKNFSRAKKIDENTVYALDWDINLTIKGPIPYKLSSVGVRAHSFMPAQTQAAQNYLPAQILEQVESPFEWNVLFKNKEAKSKTQPIWWKCSKQAFPAGLPNGFSVAPQDILLLEDGFAEET
ncbi:ATP-binding cassette domain-containing protein [Ruminococcaceae bacterium OttesenSCG-928-A16]|nr:ATP-binding cassette domain-containing protein [Ruminococcaceae bacterium OttesenSCG-928-A16]